MKQCASSTGQVNLRSFEAIRKFAANHHQLSNTYIDQEDLVLFWLLEQCVNMYIQVSIDHWYFDFPNLKLNSRSFRGHSIVFKNSIFCANKVQVAHYLLIAGSSGIDMKWHRGHMVPIPLVSIAKELIC